MKPAFVTLELEPLRAPAKRPVPAPPATSLQTPLPSAVDLHRDRVGKARWRARRAFNVVMAAVLLILTSPLMLILAVLIRVTSPGPVIFKQTRVGIDRRRRTVQVAGDRRNAAGGRRKVDYGGRLFTMYKFRTMAVNQEAKLQIWASPNDARVTPIGRVLRRCRLDELPQLVNVLLGDMNIVGPRPEQPRIFMDLRGQVEGYALRQCVLPGITGWAQINHGYDSSIEDVRTKVRYDLEYICRQSVLQDLRILLLTLPVLVLGRGAL